MNTPANLVAANGNVTHAGAVNTTQTDTILAAPGAGLRYRIWHASISYDDVNTGGVLVIGGLDFTTDAVAFWRWGIRDGDPADQLVLPAGYAPINPNTALRLRNWKANAGAGATTIRWAVMYTLESV